MKLEERAVQDLHGLFKDEAGLGHAIEFGRTVVREALAEREGRETNAQLCTETEVRGQVDEFLERYRRAGGEGLRAELVRGLPGMRLTIVCDWEDM